jgi:pimeloyl-ACP methyl ester carboxylesterase
VLGGCIGGSYCLNAVAAAPGRIASAVLQNPIGVHPEHTTYFPDSHREWSAEQRAARPELDPAALAGFGCNMWDHDIVFCVDRAFAKTCPAPTLLLPGTDIPHPAATSAELAALLPGVEVLTAWRGPEHLVAQEAAVVDFLRRHTPA